MKVCLINNLYKPYARGGAETVVELIADGLRNAGHQVFIITTKSPLDNHRRIGTRGGWEDFKGGGEIKIGRQGIYYINSLFFNINKMPKFLRLFWHFIDMFDVGSYFAVRRVLKKENPDVVMTHNLKGVGYLIPRAIRNLKIKHIHTLHDIQLLHPSGLMLYGKEKTVNGVFSKFYQFMCRRLFCGSPLTKGVGGICSPDIIISPSKWLLEEHVNRGFFKDSKKVVLPNPMGIMNHESGIRNQGERIFKFLYVGLIEKHKGILFLINAFNNWDAPADIGVGGMNAPLIKGVGGILESKLLIAGSGSKLKHAQELIGKNKNIKLLGRIKNDEAVELMRSSDCLIMPSLCYENSPTVIYEAMASGLPVIASRIGGVPELVDDNLLFKPGDEKDLMVKIEWALKNKDKIKKMAASRQKEINEFKDENYIKRLMEL